MHAQSFQLIHILVLNLVVIVALCALMVKFSNMPGPKGQNGIGITALVGLIFIIGQFFVF